MNQQFFVEKGKTMECLNCKYLRYEKNNVYPFMCTKRDVRFSEQFVSLYECDAGKERWNARREKIIKKLLTGSKK